MPPSLVYGKLKTLSKIQARSWARFALWEKDLVFFALPVACFILFVVFHLLQERKFVSLYLEPVILIGLLTLGLYAFLRSCRFLSQRISLQIQQETEWGGIFLIFEKMSYYLRRMLRYALRSQTLSYAWTTMGFHRVFGILFVSLLLLKTIWPLSLPSQAILLWISFEVILFHWQRRREFRWLDRIFLGGSDGIMKPTLVLSILTGIVFGSLHYALWSHSQWAFLFALNPFFATFVCFYGGMELGLYSRVLYGILFSSIAVISWFQPLFWIVVIFFLGSQLEHARRQVNLSYNEDSFR